MISTAFPPSPISPVIPSIPDVPFRKCLEYLHHSELNSWTFALWSIEENAQMEKQCLKMDGKKMVTSLTGQTNKNKTGKLVSVAKRESGFVGYLNSVKVPQAMIEVPVFWQIVDDFLAFPLHRRQIARNKAERQKCLTSFRVVRESSRQVPPLIWKHSFNAET